MWKKIVTGLLALVVLFVIVGFFLPDKVEITRSISINAPAEYSFEEIDKLENWKKWSYWNTLDDNMQVTYSDKLKGAGAFYQWDSEDMGVGKLTITESSPFKFIKADLEFVESGPPARSWFTFEPEGENTTLTMGFSSDMGMNPLMRWMGATWFKYEMDKAFDHNLTKLKALAESKPKFTIELSEETVKPITYIGINHTMSPKDINAVSAQMGKMYNELSGVLKKSRIELKGHPFCLYPSYSAESMDMICALPVAANVKLPAKYKIARTQQGKAVKGIHRGPYDKLEASHNQVIQFLEFKNHEINGAPWEVYITDPGTEPDPSKWVTEIYYPVKERVQDLK